MNSVQIKFNLFISIIVSSFSLLSQSCDEIYTLTRSVGFNLSTLDSSTGNVTDISSSEITPFLGNSGTTINPFNEVMYLIGFDNQPSNSEIICLDLNSGAVISNMMIVDGNLSNLNFNCIDEKLYALNFTDNGYFLVELDPLTGMFTTISPNPITQLLGGSIATIDNQNGIMCLIGLDNANSVQEIICVDLSSGLVVSRNDIQNGSITSLKFNCNDGKYYGLNLNNEGYFLASIDPLTGTISNLSIAPVAQLLGGANPALNPIEHVYYFLGIEGANNDAVIICVDLINGNVISNNSIISDNPITGLNSNCNACCIECESTHGTLGIKSISDN